MAEFSVVVSVVLGIVVAFEIVAVVDLIGSAFSVCLTLRFASCSLD